MCGRFAIDGEINDLIEEFVATGGVASDWRPSWNIHPTERVPIVVDAVSRDPEHAGEVVRRIETARWSLVPPWSKELKLKYPTFNARSEDVATKASFKASVVSKRALIPATGYYEWHTVNGTKRPYFIHDPDGTMAFAGLYSWWKNPAAAEDDPSRWVLTTTMLTMAAVPALASIHDRNPVPLPREFWDDWLSPAVTGDQSLVDAAVAAAVPVASGLEFHEVGPVRGDGPELMRAVG